MVKESQVNQKKSLKKRTDSGVQKVSRPSGTKRLLKLMVGFLLILGVAQILVCCYLADRGHQLKELEQKNLSLGKENRILQKEIANFIGLSKVKRQALEQGFISNPSVLDLSSQPPVALKP